LSYSNGLDESRLGLLFVLNLSRRSF